MKKNLKYLFILSALVYFAQGFEGIVNLPLFFYLKEHLHLSPQKIMYISAIITLAWLIKPLFGYFIDQYFSKKIWIIYSIIGSIIVSLYFGLSPLLTLPLIIIMASLGSYFTATRDISNDGLACCEGKQNNTCDIFQNVQWTSLTIAGIITSLSGGFIADHFNYKFAYLCLIPIYLIILLIISKYSSRPVITQKQKLIITILSYKELFTNKTFMLGSLFIFLFNFNPSFGTPLQFIERDIFKWSGTFMGIIGAIASGISIIGSIIYYKFSKKLDVRKILYWSVFASALTTLFYLYFTPISAIIYTCIFSILGMFIFLNLMTFMARSSINGKESTSFALLCSISNLAGFCSTLVGAWLFPLIGLKWLIILSAITSFFCLPLIKYLKLEKVNA
jgi:MFS family permease